MSNIFHKKTVCCALVLIVSCFFSEILAAKSQEEYDYSHRTRDCKVRIVTPDRIPIPYLLVGFGLLRHSFLFGGTIRSDAFDNLGDLYGEMFENYFDAGTPEHEMKWGEIMKCAQKCDPNFSKADFLVNWMKKKNIVVRGSNLFSNEDEEQLPEWTRNLGTAEFKLAMQERINSTLDYFKGNVVQWDVITEICHGVNGLLPSGGILPTKSGESNVFSWILEEAKKVDSVPELVITDYDIINDSAAADEFINKVKPFKEKFDVVGAVAHFGANIDKNSYQAKINYIAEQLGKPVLLTDVDFSCDISEAPAKLEELMRSCFANPNVRGIVMGSWHQKYRRRSDLTNYFVDSLNKETEVGKKWREIVEELRTFAGGFTDSSGIIKFNGFVGQYQVHISCFLDTFSLNSGKDTQYVEVVYHHVEEENVRYSPSSGLKKIEVKVNGMLIPIKIPMPYNNSIFIATYSLSGQLLSRFSVPARNGGSYYVPTSQLGCRIFRIETNKGLPLYTGKIMKLSR
ncbi:MAG: endo-1,4-beta-xylanase [Chitinispirillaceae bacterium]|nr:endo-1,4-beta-xylanase [Chitinispirillaceae bacterium]